MTTLYLPEETPFLFPKSSFGNVFPELGLHLVFFLSNTTFTPVFSPPVNFLLWMKSSFFTPPTLFFTSSRRRLDLTPPPPLRLFFSSFRKILYLPILLYRTTLRLHHQSFFASLFFPFKPLGFPEYYDNFFVFLGATFLQKTAPLGPP